MRELSPATFVWVLILGTWPEFICLEIIKYVTRLLGFWCAPYSTLSKLHRGSWVVMCTAFFKFIFDLQLNVYLKDPIHGSGVPDRNMSGNIKSERPTITWLGSKWHALHTHPRWRVPRSLVIPPWCGSSWLGPACPEPHCRDPTSEGRPTHRQPFLNISSHRTLRGCVCVC